MGWSFPMTSRTWAKPSAESFRQTRSTVAPSSARESARSPFPYTRSRDAISFRAGTDCASSGGGAGDSEAASSSGRRPPWSFTPPILELVAHAKGEGLVLTRAGAVAEEGIVRLEDNVPERLVGQAEGGDPPGIRRIAGGARGHRGVEIVALMPREGQQPLAGGGLEQRHEVDRSLEVAALDAAPHVTAVGLIDAGRIPDRGAHHDAAEGERPRFVAGIGGEHQDRRIEAAGTDQGILIGGAAIPEGPRQLQA